MTRWLWLLLLAAPLCGGEEAERPRAPLDRFFKGKIVRLADGRVTLYYDFEDEAQLQDFEAARPPHLLDAGQNDVAISGGRLHLKRSSSIRHRMEGQRRIEARFLVNVEKPGCVGTVFTEPVLSGSYSLTTIWDCRFYRNRKFYLMGIGLQQRDDDVTKIREGLLYRVVTSIDPRVVAKTIQVGKDCEMEVVKEDWYEWVRLGPIHRQGSLKSKMEKMAGVQFGFWVHEADASFDDLYLTIEPPQEFLDLNDLELRIGPAAPAITERAEKRLAQAIAKAPLGPEAAAAARELSRRGPDGWKELVKLIRRFARSQPYAAVPLIEALALGDEKDRREILVGLFRAHKQPEIRLAVARGLAPFYPEYKELIHDALELPLPGRVELFRAVVSRGLPDEIVRRFFLDEKLGREAYEVLRARSAKLGGELGRLPTLRAMEGHSPTSANAFAQEFAETRDWDLLIGLIGLLDHKDKAIREGAYLLVLGASGKDIPPDKDLWMSWVSAKRDEYEPPPPSAPGPVAAAILRGRAFLKRDLLADGKSVWPTTPDWPGTQVGATALSVLALRAAGTKKDDPAIEKVLHETLLVNGKELRPDLEGYTYGLSILTMALASLDRETYQPQLTQLAHLLSEGQLPNGQWTYRCNPAEHKKRRIVGDNSNTQYAILGLRAAKRAGVEVKPEVFERTAKFWMANANAYGGWGYGPKGSFDHETAMTAAGISTLIICAEALFGPDALHQVKDDKRIGMGQVRLGEILLQKGYAGEEIYTFYGIERTCILTGTKSFNDFDWYHEGAKILVDAQKDNGAWGDNAVRGVATGRGYGEAVDTAFALLFLKRATTRLLGVDEGGVVKVPETMRPVKIR